VPASARGSVEDIILKKIPELSDLQPAQHSTPPTVPEETSIDDELREWKRSRKGGFRIPWRQLSLMTSLCFGLASFVLPEPVNGDVRWLLFALTAASFGTWIAKRGRVKG
jgi:hypothetical protein